MNPQVLSSGTREGSESRCNSSTSSEVHTSMVDSTMSSLSTESFVEIDGHEKKMSQSSGSFIRIEEDVTAAVEDNDEKEAEEAEEALGEEGVREDGRKLSLQQAMVVGGVEAWQHLEKRFQVFFFGRL